MALAVAFLATVFFVALPEFLSWYFTSHRGGCHKCVVDLMVIDQALRSYADDHDGAVPSTLEELVETRPGYLDHVPFDPWGRLYRLEPGAPGELPRVFSLGRDDRPGGSGLDRDHDIASCRTAR